MLRNEDKMITNLKRKFNDNLKFINDEFYLDIDTLNEVLIDLIDYN